MNPFDALTEKEKLQFYDIITTDFNSTASFENLPQILNVWNQNKRRIFKLFGNKNRIKISLKNIKDKNIINYTLIKILQDAFYDSEFFIFTTEKYIELKNYKILDNFYNLIKYINFIENRINEDFIYTYKNNVYKIQSGTKFIRAFKLYIKNTMPQDCVDVAFKLLEKLRIKIDTLKSRHIANFETVILSINPIDYMNLSYNNENWTSCFAKTDGCYRNSCISYMNGKNNFIAYVENNDNANSKKMYSALSDSYMPSMSWRCLFFINKTIITSGKPYPFYNKDLVSQILDIIKNMATKKFNWHYRYGPQPYLDTIGYNNNQYIKDFIIDGYNFYINKHFSNKKNIFLTTGPTTFNDWINATAQYKKEFLCYRNPVQHFMHFSADGPLTCMNCGKIINTDITTYYQTDYNSYRIEPYHDSCEYY